MRLEYPGTAVPLNHIEPVPRRIRGYLGGELVVDTVAARYVWEIPPYPQYYIPLDDVAPGVLRDEDHPQRLSRGTARLHTVLAGGVERPSGARVYGDDALPGVAGHVRFEWSALDAWFEEEEQVFVHPRNPYARVDAIRSSRRIRIEVDGVVLAESSAPVIVFETGLPPRFYLDRSCVRWDYLSPVDTVTECPYKGVTGGYWSARVVGGSGTETVVPEVAWTYTFTTRQLLPIAGLIAFFDERVDTFLDGRRLVRPVTPFTRRTRA